MTKVFNRLKMMACVCAIALCAASCSNDDEYRNRATFSSCFTILGSMPNYTLVDDSNNRFYPTLESVKAVTDNAGFGQQKRVQLYGYYDMEKDVEKGADGTFNVRNVTLQGGQYILTVKAKSVAQLKEENLLSLDSIFPIQSLSNYWIANGYLNTLLVAQYSANGGAPILPSVNIYAREESIKENEVTLEVLYNRHSSKNVSAAGMAEQLNSFDISELQIPGQDSIMVRLEIQGVSPIKKKVARKALEALK